VGTKKGEKNKITRISRIIFPNLLGIKKKESKKKIGIGKKKLQKRMESKIGSHPVKFKGVKHPGIPGIN